MRHALFVRSSGVALSGLTLVALLAACSGRATEAQPSNTPNTPAAVVIPAPIHSPKVPVVDEYHGVKVTDNYRWLENWSDPKVQSWSEAQNTAARGYLDSLPSAPSVRERLTALESSESVSYDSLAPVAGGFLAIKHQPPKQQAFLVFLPSLTDLSGERTVVDPNVIDAKGLTTIDWFVPSPDSSKVAVSLSTGGSEAGDVTVFDFATGAATTDFVPRVHGGTAGGSLAWNVDGSGFFYTRYPRNGERAAGEMDFYQKAFFHTLGTSGDRDTYELGNEFDTETAKIAEVQLERSADGAFVLASVQKGDGGEFVHFVRPTAQGAAWKQFTSFDDQIVYATFGGDGSIYAVSNKGTLRGSVVRFDPRATAQSGTAAKSDVVIAESKASIATDFFAHNGLWVTGSRIFVLYQTGGPSELREFSLAGKLIGTVPTEPISEIGDAMVLADGGLAFESQSFIAPPAWFTFASGSKTPKRTSLAQTSPATFEGCEVIREFATSKDGTKVPLNIIKRKGLKLDGTTPTILNGYGGYGVNITPGFSPRRQLWLERGGVFVVANIRGGGEFGEEWHRQGNLLNKQNVFDDFAACARHLIERKYTSKDKLAIMGGSNGGLLMAATFTQNPGLCKAVVSSVGIYDMLRVELSPNGAFNITEFGTVTDPDQFKALSAYSPYHHVKDGTRYPAVL
ncbi:MAG: prolyl oligopeptidase family serine peptidase, partial [bacterium]|nr:prolyl oligopeptidase family serine peptidase [bacterium]